MTASNDVKLKHEDSKATLTVAKDVAEDVYKPQGWHEPGDKPEQASPSA